jgi:N-methylhydantoinase A
LFFCEQAGYRNLLTFDMGGTSTDVALIQDAKTNIRRETIVGDVRVRAPSVDVRTIGAGGGSIAFVAELTKALRVGPESAGAVPGPAAYMKGGELPTVCDANVVLGYLPSDAQLGGAMAINRDAAVAAVQKVADALGIDVMEAAEGIIRIANEAMFGALRLVSVEQGYDPRDFSLVGFGGAGPLHANALGRLVNSFPVIVPPGPGVLCAYGDATTQLQDEAARSYGMLAGDISPDQLKQDLSALRDRAAQALLADGIPEDQLDVTYQADVRYAGQAFQISVNFDIAGVDANGLAVITDVFDDEHEKLFTFKLGDGHEIVMIRAVVSSRGQSLEIKLTQSSDATLADCAIHATRIYFEGNWYDATIYERYKLHTELVVPGPAIVTEMDSTTLILPGYQARTDAVGNLLIEPSASEQGA